MCPPSKFELKYHKDKIVILANQKASLFHLHSFGNGFILKFFIWISSFIQLNFILIFTLNIQLII